MNNKNDQKIEFALRRFPYEFMITFLIFWCIIFLPIWINQLFMPTCSDNYCPIPNWALTYSGTAVILVFIALFTGHGAKPWEPFLTISEEELRYNQVPFFLHFAFFDKFLWRKFPLKSIAAIQLVIRAQDADKAGFTLYGNSEYVKGLSFDQYISLLAKNNLYRPTVFLNLPATAPYYKNQKLEFLDKNKATIAELIMSFAYEEDLRKLHKFLQKKNISFSVAFRN